MADRYTITDRVDSGGMAEVFRGVAESIQGFNKNVAIKRILAIDTAKFKAAVAQKFAKASNTVQFTARQRADSLTLDPHKWLYSPMGTGCVLVRDRAALEAAFRVSGEELEDGPGFMKYTVAPAYRVNENFLVRAEVSYYDYKDYGTDKALFYGLQSVFRF